MFNDDSSQKVKDSLNSLLQVLTLVLMVSLILIGVSIFKTIREAQYVDDSLKTRDTFQVSGSSEGYYAPDMAQVTFSVISEAETVSEVTNSNSTKMNQVITAMKEIGVSEDDLQTREFNLRPRYEYHDDNDNGSRRVLVGYQLTQSLVARLHDLDKVGTALSRGTTAGANDVTNLAFSIEEDEKIRKELREKAITDAKEKAAVLEDQVGFKLGKIINFNESGGSYIPRPLFQESYNYKQEGNAPDVNIESGTNKMEINVTLTYELQ